MSILDYRTSLPNPIVAVHEQPNPPSNESNHLYNSQFTSEQHSNQQPLAASNIEKILPLPTADTKLQVDKNFHSHSTSKYAQVFKILTGLFKSFINKIWHKFLSNLLLFLSKYHLNQ